MKLLKVLVAAVVLVAMVTPAIAEDRLSLSGEMRVRGWHTDYDNDEYTDTWADQRLRIAGKLAVNENVSVTFRTDITEGSNWGDESSFAGTTGPIRSNGAGSARSGAQQQWDRAHLDINLDNFHLRAGQQYVGTGGVFAVDTQDNGLLVDVAGAVPVTAYLIVDANNNVDDGGDGGADAFLYGATATIKPAKVFVAGFNDGSDEEVYVIGASGSLDLDAISLFGELDVFTGDATATQDAFGTQLFLDASMAATDAVTVGLQGFYAAGDDEDAQYTGLGNGFNGWDPLFDVGTSLSNEALAIWAQSYGGGSSVFDFSGNSQGVVGGRLYAGTMLGAVKLGASAAYLTVEDDHTSDDEMTAFAAGMAYDIVDNASFQLQLQQINVDDGTTDEDIFTAASGIFVNF